MRFHQPRKKHPSPFSDIFLQAFTQLALGFDLRGKFSLIPYPGGVITSPEFVAYCNTLDKSRWDFTSEGFTHMYEESSGNPSQIREDEFFNSADVTTQYLYLLKIFRYIESVFGLKISGVTSPWSSGSQNRDIYEHAISLAMQEYAPEILRSWYFLDINARQPYRCRDNLYHVSANIPDFTWRSQYPNFDGAEALRKVKCLILRRMGKNPPLITILSHWQSLYSGGSLQGLKLYYELFSWIRDSFPERSWIRPSQYIQFL